LWGLLFEAYPIARGTEAKIAWHVTGKGRITITATGPDHLEIKPAWGPEAHLSSNWERPGDEWGTGFVFPAAGCWTVRFERGENVSTASLLVADRPQ